MINTFDGNSFKRTAGKKGDRAPATGFQRTRVVYTATGGETSINLAATSPAITYKPGNQQLSIFRNGYKLANGVDVFETSPSTLGFAASEALIAGEVIEILVEFALTGIMAASVRPDYFYQSGTAGQTLVTCSFSWPYNLLPSIGGGGARVFLNGVLQTPGQDYTEVNLSNANTNQFSFVDALVGNENIQVYPGYEPIDTSAAASNFQGQQLQQLQNWVMAGTQAFIDQSALISVPNSTVVRRAQIPDLANDLRASFGIDRIVVQQIYDLPGEAGANGERVQGALNDDRGLIRFVGDWRNNPPDNTGSAIIVGTNTTDYIEIVFYGTGLNFITYAVGDARDARVSIDGLAEGTGGAAVGNLFTGPTTSSVLGSRFYNVNNVFAAANGLTLGIHTARIRTNNVTNFRMYGFEILNATASNASVKVNPGSAYINGQKYQSLAQQSLAYNAGVTGVKGGRQLVYLTAAGTIANAFQAVNTSQANMAAADHTNEAEARIYDIREFGSGTTTDFSTINTTVSNRAFTLEDGTTSLYSAGTQISSTTNALQVSTINDFITFNFVGCGLDILQIDNSTTTDQHTFFIDGVSVGTSTAVGASNIYRTTKIVSGLPYGTHSFKMVRNANAVGGLCIRSFKVYQPKKPTLPAGAIELADFNVMATFVANTTATDVATSTGVLRKQSSREISYVGAGWSITADNASAGGYRLVNTTNADYLEYTFYGTGFDLRGEARTSGTATLSLQALSSGGSLQTLNSTNFPGLATSAYAYAFNYATGAITTVSAGSAGGVVVSGLALGMYKVRMTLTSANPFFIHGFDLITPIHSHKSNLYGNVQNTLTLGSQGLTDTRKISMIKEPLPGYKAWVQALGNQVDPTTTSSTLFVPVPDMNVSLRTTGGAIEIEYICHVVNNTANSGVFMAIVVDGVMVTNPNKYVNGVSTNYVITIADTIIVPASAGVHKIELHWHTDGSSTATAKDRIRVLKAREI